MASARARVSIMGPVLLIGVGVLLLLNSLGLFSWSVWEVLLRLWPVLLIAAGLDLLMARRSAWGAVFSILLVAGVVVGGLYLLPQAAARGEVLELGGYEWSPGEAERGEVVLEPAVGNLDVSAGEDAAGLAEGQVWLAPGFNVSEDFTLEGGKATLNLGLQGAGSAPTVFGTDGFRRWQISLSPAIPLDVIVRMGAGQANLDLRGLRLRSLTLEMGVGQATVKLPAQGSYSVSIKGAVGQTVIVLPPGAAARIHLKTGLAARSLPSGYLSLEDDTYQSPAYARSDEQVELQLEQAIGWVSISDG